MKNQKQGDSIIIGAGVWSVLFIGMGIFDLVTKKNGYWSGFLLGGLSFIYLIYLLWKTKGNTNERYEDERKKFVSDKSKSMSFDKLFVFMVIFEILIKTQKIKMDSHSAIMELWVVHL
ncbi:hypothetical protein KPL35_14055 [Clostridium sp. CF011]|uniref:hypothetical protein n=1 Tax=Clostridium sp. CF011 TaxID=2843318 RepID=UPI001C0B2E63|nr:hypothetical protein [Clostridium sp. CF011]MBU3093195.1 hypothetical protein [Clostridium sp. CF011]WAG69300.1 hypothetical protein LL036_15060 [Clostridium sp. CF011]